MNKNLVEGRVLDEKGCPVAGAYVTLKSETVPVQDIASITSAEGRFRLRIPFGDFSVYATTKSGMHGMTKISDLNDDRFSPIIHLHA